MPAGVSCIDVCTHGKEVVDKVCSVLCEGSVEWGVAALALAAGEDNLLHLVVLPRVAVDDVPVVEDHLRERLARRVLAEEAGEAERLGDGEVRLDVVHRRARPVGLLDDGAALAVEARVDAAHGVLRTLDLHKEDRLLQARLRDEHGGEEDAARRGDDLAAAAVDGVRVQHHVHKKTKDGYVPLKACRSKRCKKNQCKGREEQLLP